MGWARLPLVSPRSQLLCERVSGGFCRPASPCLSLLSRLGDGPSPQGASGSRLAFRPSPLFPWGGASFWAVGLRPPFLALGLDLRLVSLTAEAVLEIGEDSISIEDGWMPVRRYGASLGPEVVSRLPPEPAPL